MPLPEIPDCVVQNQQRKFDALWALLDEHSRKHVDERNQEPESEPAGATRRTSRNIECFSHWIEAVPLEKWSLLHDTDGARYGIMTTNLAEVYNWVLRGLRSQPLVAIVEGAQHNRVFQGEAFKCRTSCHQPSNTVLLEDYGIHAGEDREGPVAHGARDGQYGASFRRAPPG